MSLFTNRKTIQWLYGLLHSVNILSATAFCMEKRVCCFLFLMDFVKNKIAKEGDKVVNYKQNMVWNFSVNYSPTKGHGLVTAQF